MELWIGAINLGFLYSFMGIGTFITYKIYNFPDITIEGSFTAGAAIASVLIISDMDPFLVVLFSFAGGAAAGLATGLIHTKFKINGLLAGIIVMTGIYSINLRVMGKSNIPLLNSPSFLLYFDSFNPGMNNELWLFVCLFVVMILFWVLISAFFKTDFGLNMRAAGSNALMVSANGVNENGLKVFGVALANGLVGVSGGLVAQYQGFSDIGMGVGTVVASMAAVIIGEAIIKHRSIFLKVFSVILGSVIFRLMVALALLVGLNPNDLKLITAAFVLLTLVTTGVITGKKKKISFDFIKKNKKLAYTGTAILVLAAAGFYSYQFYEAASAPELYKIAVVLPNDSDMLTNTREGFMFRMKELGYEEGKNCTFMYVNANGDIPTLNTIVDNFINKDVDLYLSISTASTQSIYNKVKNKPIVFATVANPFIIGVGKSDTDHPENVTGIYGSMPMGDLMKIAREIYPNKFRVGCIWNPSFPNSVDNVNRLKKVIAEDSNIEFRGTTITSTNEVSQGAQSLANEDIDAFFLVPDICVYSAFDAVVKAANTVKIPIFSGDVERLPDGALAVYGYEYFVSGIQAADMVNRILKGESPGKIPYEKYKAATLGLNMDMARKFGVEFPEDIISRANAFYENGKLRKDNKNNIPGQNSSSQKRIAVFQFQESPLLNLTTDGLINQMEQNGLLKEYNAVYERFNAHGDFGTAQSIAKDIVSKKFDYIATISTIAMQVTANNNKKIPHVFCAVTDPFSSGVAVSPADHIANLTGLATPQPVESTIKFMREIMPKARKIGMVWNPSEANSEYCTKLARKAAEKYKFQLVEKTVSNTNDIEEVVKAVINEKVDIFFTSGDVTVSMVVPSIAKKMTENKIAYFTNTPNDINSGVFFAIGADYPEVGSKAADILKKVVMGKETKDIPIETYVPEKYNINTQLAKQLGISVPKHILKAANTVIN